MILSLIAAISDNNVIGYKNGLPWKMPADLSHFSAITTGHTVIMGRKTFESMGKPLAKRRNLVITRNKDFPVVKGLEVVHSLEEAFKEVKKEEETFIIGGSRVYEIALDMNLVQLMYITRVHANVEGDSYFPEVDWEKWSILSSKTHQPDKNNPYSYTFEMYNLRK